jgi:hypothetical protein
VPEPTEPPVRHPAVPSREPVQRWRLIVSRTALDPDQAARTQQGAWEAALVASGLPLTGLDTESARPRLAMAAPLAPAIPGEHELVDVWLTDRRPRWNVRELLGASMPDGWTLIDLFDVWPGEASLPGQVVASVYRATVDPVGAAAEPLEAAATAMLAAPTLARERLRGDRAVPYDLRPFVDDISVGRGSGGVLDIVMVLRHDPEKGVGRPDEVLAELASQSGVPLAGAKVVRERLVLATERASTATRPALRGPGRAGGRGAPGSATRGGS